MIAAEVEWNAVTLAGAFVLGAVLGTVAVIRLVHVVFGITERQRRDEEAPR